LVRNNRRFWRVTAVAQQHDLLSSYAMKHTEHCHQTEKNNMEYLWFSDLLEMIAGLTINLIFLWS
jgi:hypothetical protein